MYSFEYGGNILDFFGRYRKKLQTREDIQKVSGLSSEDERRLMAIYNVNQHGKRQVRRTTASTRRPAAHSKFQSHS